MLCLEDPWSEEEIHCGDLITTSRFISSIVSDQKLYFAHEVMKEDCEMRPDWEPYLPKWVEPTFDGFNSLEVGEVVSRRADDLRNKLKTESDWTCPFAFLFEL